MTDQPLSYWMAVARIGFEDDFSRLFDELGISRSALAAILQIRLIKEEGEVLRVVDYATDSGRITRTTAGQCGTTSQPSTGINVA